MLNERITEGIVRDQMARLGNVAAPIVFEEQRSAIAPVRRLLANASKRGTGERGEPEFIVTNPHDPDVVVVIECKASVKDHRGPARASDPVRFACDGVLWYAQHLSREFQTVAIAVSGTDPRTLRVSTYLWPKGAAAPRELTAARSERPLDRLVPWGDYVEAVNFDPEVERARIEDLLVLSRSMHSFMRDYAKLTESEKPLLVAGTLIALMDKPFRASYSQYAADELQEGWFRAITSQLAHARLPQTKVENITQPYSSIEVHPELSKPTPKFPRGPLFQLIRILDTKVYPLIDVYRDYDVVGSFYGEFLKYTGGDKKSLGIVLTPRHITDLFCRLAEVTKDDTVLDICCGTGGFLISAMARMLDQCRTEAERDEVKRDRLVGIESQPNMYALAASNMLLRGDGKANLYLGDCFDLTPAVSIKHRPTVGLINPPYHQRGEGQHELDFVRAMLDSLEPGGRGIAIVPVACAVRDAGKAALLVEHRLEAVMSLPRELFAPVGVTPCAMVFTAHRPHAATPDRKTWFARWDDDGFVRTKHQGRVDQNDQWESIRDRWVDAFINRRCVTGKSVMRRVGPDDEWLAEPYLETDYSSLDRHAVEAAALEYTLFRLRQLAGMETNGEEAE
ncbi:MAG: SAM-dependent methyltransferase [Bifidobacteriaceae bacterium]|nr:SAM-dependent methyltransferase [Bifidobacteriaceae bacterium]